MFIASQEKNLSAVTGASLWLLWLFGFPRHLARYFPCTPVLLGFELGNVNPSFLKRGLHFSEVTDTLVEILLVFVEGIC